MNQSCIQPQNKSLCLSSRRFRYGIVNLFCLAVAGGTQLPFATAQSSSALTAVYGRGVHAYFAGNSAMAEQLFTEVIQAGSADPRPYYFRGVLRLNQGRQFEAENDMRIGAAYEARNPGVQHSIGRALQRVQGPARRTLEGFRRQARLDRANQGRQRTLQRYQQLEQRAPAVLREGTQVPLTQPVEPPQMPSGSGSTARPMVNAPMVNGSGAKQPAVGSGTNGSGANPAVMGSGTTSQPLQAPAIAQPAPSGSGIKQIESDPFGTPAAESADDDLFGSGTVSETPTPAPSPVPTEADPFGEMPAPVAEEADPFGAAPADTPAPAEEQAAPVEDDPFAEPADADPPAETEDDLFGESSDSDMQSDEAAEDNDPFGESPAEPADEDDPFGESTDDSAAEDDPFGESSEEMAEEDDPFGESEPSADEDDPFGESSSDSSEEAPADESDPFGEDMSDEGDSTPEEDSSDSSEETFDEDDPFGPLGNVPASTTGAFASQSNPTDSGMSGQLFFALGQWLGSQGSTRSSSYSSDGEVAQADFELGPADSNMATAASADMSPADISATPQRDQQPVAQSADVDPFGDDPFGDDPFAE